MKWIGLLAACLVSEALTSRHLFICANGAQGCAGDPALLQAEVLGLLWGRSLHGSLEGRALHGVWVLICGAWEWLKSFGSGLATQLVIGVAQPDVTAVSMVMGTGREECVDESIAIPTPWVWSGRSPVHGGVWGHPIVKHPHQLVPQPQSWPLVGHCPLHRNDGRKDNRNRAEALSQWKGASLRCRCQRMGPHALQPARRGT